MKIISLFCSAILFITYLLILAKEEPSTNIGQTVGELIAFIVMFMPLFYIITH